MDKRLNCNKGKPICWDKMRQNCLIEDVLDGKTKEEEGRYEKG